jgi:hypothetical protein
LLTDDEMYEGYLAPISNIFENFPFQLLSIPDTKIVFENKYSTTLSSEQCQDCYWSYNLTEHYKIKHAGIMCPNQIPEEERKHMISKKL